MKPSRITPHASRAPITNSLRATRKCVAAARQSAANPDNKATVEFKGGKIEVQWNEKNEEATVAILDSIGKDPWGEGGFTEKDFRNALAEIPRSKKLNLLINSRGGDVFEGFGIKNAIAEWPEKVTATITGVAASTASWMILDADEVRAPRASQMFIHEAMTLAAGNADDMRETANRLDKTSDQIAGFYAAKNGKTAAAMRELMKQNTLMTGAEAKDLGFVDVLTDDAPTNNFTDAEITAMRSRLVMLNAAATSAPVQGAKPTETNNAQKETQMTPTETAPAPTGQTPPTVTNQIPADLQAKLTAMENRLREQEVARVTREFNELAATRPTVNRETWLPKVIADPSNLELVRAMPEAPEPMAIGATNRIQVLGNPLIEAYNDVKLDTVQRGDLAKRQYNELRKQLMIASHVPIANLGPGTDWFNFNLPSVRNANTVDAALANTILSGDFVTTMRTYIAPWNAFTRTVATSPVSRRQTLEVPLASSAGSKQQNATNYETGDSTLAPIAVTVAEESKSFHISRPEQNLGLALAALVPTNAKVLAEGIHAKMTALMIAANYGAATTIGAAANFDTGDLPAILALGKNYDRVNLLLDGGHLAYLLPTLTTAYQWTESQQTVVPAGAFGFDGIWKNNLWTGGVANIVGFVCGPDAIVNAWGAADGLPAGDAIAQSTVDVNGIPFSLTVWFSRATRAVWASFQVMHGCAVGDNTQAENLVTA